MSTTQELRAVLARPGSIRESIEVPADAITRIASILLGDGYRLALIAATDAPGTGTGSLSVSYLFTSGPPDRRVEVMVGVDRAQPEIPSLARLSFPASRFEREMHDLFGIVPVGHPFLRRLVLHQHWPQDWYPMRHDAAAVPAMVDDADSYPFVEVQGAGVYEIPVGPVHAGLIEPGHFRFSVVGETILKMTARLWFVHKGTERLFEGRELPGGIELAERVSGDTAVGHCLAYCLAAESACGLAVPRRATELRAALLELERIYNHVADVGALCNDVGYAIVHAKALTLRERLLRLNKSVAGHRLLRGGVRLGGVRVERLPGEEELAEIGERFHELVDMALGQSIVMDRFTGTAVLALQDVQAMGVLGVAARASGAEIDAWIAHPIGPGLPEFSSATATSGDVLARFQTRVQEVDASLALLRELRAAGAAAGARPGGFL